MQSFVPEISRFNGMTVSMRWDDHNCPTHVQHAEYSASFPVAPDAYSNPRNLDRIGYRLDPNEMRMLAPPIMRTWSEVSIRSRRSLLRRGTYSKSPGYERMLFRSGIVPMPVLKRLRGIGYSSPALCPQLRQPSGALSFYESADSFSNHLGLILDAGEILSFLEQLIVYCYCHSQLITPLASLYQDE